jgi:hypothetical protein
LQKSIGSITFSITVSVGSSWKNAGEHIDESGFAAAGFANDGHELAAIQLEVYVFERSKVPRRALVRFHYVSQLNEIFIAVSVTSVRCLV